MGKGGLARLLATEVLRGDVNVCCGLLRRIFSETVEENTMQQLQRGQQQGLISDVIALGKVSLADNASLLRPATVAVLCHASQRVGDWRSALHFAEALPSPPSPSFLSSLLSPVNCDAMLHFCERKGWPLDVPHATRVLAEEHGSWLSALAVAEAMERQFHMGEWYSLGVLIPHLSASGAWERAVELFAAGIAQGSLVDPKFVGDLVRRTAELKQWQMSLYMMSVIEKTKEAAQICPSDVGFFRDVMNVSPDWQSSLAVFNIAVAMGIKPDNSMVSLLLGQCEEAKAWLVATKVYDTALMEGFVSSFAGDSYQTLIRSFHAAKQWEKALAALSWMAKAGEASAATGMNELLELCEQSGQWEAAVRIGEMLRETHPCLPVRTRLSLLFACAKGAMWQVAMEVLQDSFADASQPPHPLSICAAMQACVAANRWKDTMALLQRAREEEPRVVLPPLAHRLAVKACVGSGRWLEAIALLEDMRAYGLPRDNHTQRLGVWAAALSGNWQLSLEHLQHLPLAHRTPQDRLVVRGATRNASLTAKAIALKYLQQQ
ncbi:putative mitochondrial protein [Trypanosoma grayi]|uniref:putative mitochondrial protein n=1 Tax=Trypanosoma grayi TaxID=71804 RepID=UPI0004F4A398|nr:putative mitochondrial protein [Trypanosoma grayi]KEG14890.1 putative mitochondrial protein [Trypanosoma grayi]